MKGGYTDSNLTDEEIEEIKHKQDLDDWERYKEALQREIEILSHS